MNKIIEMLSTHTEYMLLSMVIILAAVFVTFIVNFIARQLRFVKYIPGLVLIFIGMFSLFMVINDLFAKSSLDNILVALFCISSGVIALLFALIIGIATKRKR